MGLDRQLRRANRYIVTRQQEAIQSVPKVKVNHLDRGNRSPAETLLPRRTVRREIEPARA